jgi:aspartyl/asparaginyl-tRNA synthetase
MIPQHIHQRIKKYAAQAKTDHRVAPPAYDPKRHYLDIAIHPYYHHLILLRHIFKLLSDEYMSDVADAKNVDLFMLTPSVSSPMGPGSDSEAIPLAFGNLTSYLTDSSQFGFEPILMNGIDRAYCYLPSLRGEDPDKRHLNQFYHCEIEIKGGMEEVLHIAEEYVRYLCHGILKSEELLQVLSADAKTSIKTAERVEDSTQFHRVTFDEACEALRKAGFGEFINKSEHGRDISSRGELKLFEILDINEPFWLTDFDRDRVPFYQKPNPKNPDKVLNADLLFPSLIKESFGGEILGAGQRQDTAGEMYESLSRQGLHSEPYEWYIDLRRNPGYARTSGFGLGIERFLAWILCLDNIRDVILYPRLKNVLTTP